MKIRRIICLTPGEGSVNAGDYIIKECLEKELRKMFKSAFFVNMTTHAPMSKVLEYRTRKKEYTFLCGSNLLTSKLGLLTRQWEVGLADAVFMNNIILMGVGWQKYAGRTSLYAKLIYKLLLSKKYIHSVRDTYTVEKLKSIGITNVINTGCPTMWRLTPDHCSRIPKIKAPNVVCTITAYNKDKVKDTRLLEILIEHYERVFFWPQGFKDYAYLVELGFEDRVEVIGCSLEEYDKLLESVEKLDYVGTRLHGGIRAMQKYRRSIIISIDNRAREIKSDSNIISIERENIDDVGTLIESEIETNIKLLDDNIKKWKEQFI